MVNDVELSKFRDDSTLHERFSVPGLSQADTHNAKQRGESHSVDPEVPVAP